MTQTADKAPADKAPAAKAPAGNAPATKTQTDNAPLTVEEFSGKAAAKVALDIDDAPFLVEEKAKPPEPAREQAADKPDTSAEDAARAAAALRRRKIVIASGLFVLLLCLIGAAVWYLVLREVPAPETPQPGATVIVVPTPSTVTGPAKIPVTFEDFWVPQKDKTGAVRFLRVHFSTEVTEEKFAKEITEKTLILRDAVYYYLRNKPHEFMIDADNLPAIKQDVVDILNNYLTQGKVEDLFLENFLTR